MRLGVPKEIKVDEYRVGLTPDAVAELASRGHEVFVETGAGAGIGFSDAAYALAGGHIEASAEAVFEAADLVVKVKEPQLHECRWLRPGKTLFTYLHLAADAQLTQALLDSGAACIAYETVTDVLGALPLLRPMSEVAGRMSVQVGAFYLQKPNRGRGVLLGGAPGVERGRVAIFGAGVSGLHAAQMALGLHADVEIYDISAPRLAQIDQTFGGAISTRFASRAAISRAVGEADLVIGAVLVPGATAPKLISAQMLAGMKPGAVIVDIAIDQGGCFETSRPTTHSDPVFVTQDIVHYCVANMPGAVPRTSTMALNNVTVPFVLALADKGVRRALAEDEHLRAGLNICEGKICHPEVANSLRLKNARRLSDA